MSQFDRLAQNVASFSLDTFPGQGPKAGAAKCLAEAQEFAADPSLEEAADVLITLLSWCAQTNHWSGEMLEAAEAKMVRNRQRQWNRQPDGTFRHTKATPADDPVEHPSHYTGHPSGVECIQITEHMNFCRGNAVKYIWRAGDKGDEIEDLRKARFYIDREIQRLEAARGTQ